MSALLTWKPERLIPRVTWEYARGYADGIHDALAEASDDSDEGKNEPD